MKLEKNISLGKNNFLLILLSFCVFFSIAKSEVNTKNQNEEKLKKIFTETKKIRKEIIEAGQDISKPDFRRK